MVGCLLDMTESTMMVTLNGELLFNDQGSELAAKNFDIRDGVFFFLRRIVITHRAWKYVILFFFFFLLTF